MQNVRIEARPEVRDEQQAFAGVTGGQHRPAWLARAIARGQPPRRVWGAVASLQRAVAAAVVSSRQALRRDGRELLGGRGLFLSGCSAASTCSTASSEEKADVHVDAWPLSAKESRRAQTPGGGRDAEW